MQTDHSTHHREQHSSHNESSHQAQEGGLHGKARLGFIRKVFGIVCAELLFTALWVTLVYNNTALRSFVVNSYYLGIFFAVITFVGTLALALSRTLSRTVPINYYITVAVIFSMAWSVSYFTAFFPASTVMMAAVATCSAVVGITFYAWTSNAQYNYAKAFLYSSLSILAFQLFAMFFLAPDVYNFWISVLFAISSSIAILYHTQAIIGKKTMKYSQDEYICAAMNLYIEIIQLFIELVKIIDKLQKNQEKDKKKNEKSSN